jgi:hypothetical protein
MATNLAESVKDLVGLVSDDGRSRLLAERGIGSLDDVDKPRDDYL